MRSIRSVIVETVVTFKIIPSNTLPQTMVSKLAVVSKLKKYLISHSDCLSSAPYYVTKFQQQIIYKQQLLHFIRVIYINKNEIT